MADTNNKLIILVFLICLLPHIVFSSASTKDNDTKAYVDSWCQTTSYQERCVQLLTPYVSLRANQSQEDLVQFVLHDSLRLVNDTMIRFEILSGMTVIPVLRTSLVVMTALLEKVATIISSITRGSDGVASKKVNNLQRGTSTALTDAETLVSKFQGRRLSKLEATIYEKVKNVEETTSNALAIVRRYAATY